MNKKDYETLKAIDAKLKAKQPTTFAERNKRNMIIKQNKKPKHK